MPDISRSGYLDSLRRQGRITSLRTWHGISDVLPFATEDDTHILLEAECKRTKPRRTVIVMLAGHLAKLQRKYWLDRAATYPKRNTHGR